MSESEASPPAQQATPNPAPPTPAPASEAASEPTRSPKASEDIEMTDGLSIGPEQAEPTSQNVQPAEQAQEAQQAMPQTQQLAPETPNGQQLQQPQKPSGPAATPAEVLRASQEAQKARTIQIQKELAARSARQLEAEKEQAAKQAQTQAQPQPQTQAIRHTQPTQPGRLMYPGQAGGGMLRVLQPQPVQLAPKWPQQQPSQRVQAAMPPPNPNTQYQNPRPTPTGVPNRNHNPDITELQTAARTQLYSILAALDPFRASPMEFIHLLVNAAMRDEETAKAIYRLNEERERKPNYWKPIAPPDMMATPGQSTPRQPQPWTASTGQPQNPRNRHPPQQQGQYQPMPPGPVQGQVGTNGLQGPVRPIQTSPNQAPPNRVSPNQSVSSAGPAANTNDSAVELDGEPPEPKEQSCNFTWVVDRAETHLGWTGNWDKYSEVRQTSIGYDVALKLKKLMQKMNGMMDKHVTFANRVHILTVMREIMMATLETDSRVGEECRECAREYDDNFVAAVRKLTPNQTRKLKELEGGKWLQELKDLVDEAKRAGIFARLPESLRLIDT